jgi:hypothetical protein
MPNIFRLSRFSSRAFASLMPLLLFFPARIVAGVANPDISALGQVLAGVTDDPDSPDRNHPALGLGEAEFLFDAALNPYFRGAFTVAAGDEGLELEEAYTAMVRGLPWGLGLKAGKYRLGFGKLNAVHPHALPFIEPPRAWASLLPGEEGFNETAVQVSQLQPMPGGWASTLAVDALRGSSFHPDDDRNRAGWLGRWSGAFLFGDAAALETGVSGATGVDDVGSGARGYLAGGDAKLRFYLPAASQLTLQGEAALRRSHPVDTAGVVSAETRWGAYAFADYRLHNRYNGGLLYEQAQREGHPSRTERAVRLFAGYAVLEESTVIRMAYEHFRPGGGPSVNTLSLQLLFSMGPHKAHQF